MVQSAPLVAVRQFTGQARAGMFTGSKDTNESGPDMDEADIVADQSIPESVSAAGNEDRGAVAVGERRIEGLKLQSQGEVHLLWNDDGPTLERNPSTQILVAMPPA